MHGESVSCSDHTKNSSLTVISCIDVMRLIGIDIQMIAKDKTWILLYKDFELSHSASLEEKQRI